MLPRRRFLGALLDDDDVIVELWPGAAAERAGLRVGDRLDRARVVGDPCPVETVSGAEVELGELAVDGIRQRTILARPFGVSTPPVVVMLMGLSTVSVDGFPPRPDPLLRLVAALAQAGVATLRIEKRGVGDSEGGPAHAVDFDAERRAAVAAIASLGAPRVVVFGHSMGGMIAPLVAAPHAHAIVAYGTWASRFTDGMIASTARQRPHADPRELERDAARLRAIVEDGDGDALLFGRTPEYFRQLQRTDLRAAWRAVEVPTLLLHGDGDRITSLEDHHAIASLCRHAEVRELAGLDHAMEGDLAPLVAAIVSATASTAAPTA